jgi:hypothetical protein
MAGSSISQRAQGREASGSPVWLRVGFWACTLIGVAAVIRRALVLWFPPRSNAVQVELDHAFQTHAGLTLAHILPAMAFVLVAPYVVLKRPEAGHWTKRVIYPLGLVVSLTAYAMNMFAYGGWIEQSAILFFNSIFLFSLIRAFMYCRAGERGLEARWMLRAVVVLLGIGTTRPIMGAFFATARLTHMAPNQFFGIAFWIGFSTNLIVVEWWLWRQGHA